MKLLMRYLLPINIEGAGLGGFGFMLIFWRLVFFDIF